MPRMNRQKWHRQQRLRAEARAAESAARRRAQRAHRVAEARAAQDALRGAARGVVVVDVAHPRSRALALLRDAHVTKALRRRVSRLYQVVERSVPALCAVEQLPFLLLLARQAWLREPEAWSSPGGSWRRRRDALVDHLLVRHPVPGFLRDAVEVAPGLLARVPVEDELPFRLIAHLGRGRASRALVSDGILPTPLTRRMLHGFLSAPAGTPVMRALRDAQVAGFGGPPWLGEVLMGTRLRTLQGADPLTGEAWWHDVIGWLATRADLPRDAVDGVVAWLHGTRRETLAEGRPVVLSGRPTAAVVGRARAWQARRSGRRAGVAYAASGLLPLRVVLRGCAWTFHELRSRVALAEESAAMHHCAVAYHGLAYKGRASLWSVRRDGERALTVEVTPATGEVVQVRGPANRAPCGDGSAAVARWARHNRLVLRC